MTNREKLEEAIAASGMKLSKLIEIAGIRSYATFRGRLNNETEFTASEIMAISKALNLTAEERDGIFFAANV